MIKHVFFTGKRNSGKSFAVDKVINRMGVTVSGFKTYKAQVMTGKLSKIFICDINRPKCFNMGNCVAVINDGKKPVARTTIFDTVGVQYLKETYSDIVVMDELGFLEKNAKLFEMSVRDCLNSNKLVLGVLGAEKQAPWIIEAINGNTEILELNGINNDKMIEYAIQLMLTSN